MEQLPIAPTIASCFQDKPKALRIATLDSFVFDNDNEEKDKDVVLQKFEDYLVGATNEIYARYKFNSRVQEEDNFLMT